MNCKHQVQTGVKVERSEVKQGQMRVQATLDVLLPMPRQNGELPRELESAVEQAGQELKRELFKEVVERADCELILDQRQGKEGQGIRRRGKAPYTFKTVFGTVQVKRTRVEHKSDGSEAVPAAQAWATPQGVCITPGLRESSCDAMLEQSAGSGVDRIAERAGEKGLLAKSTVLKIVESEGARLRAAQLQRADEVFSAQPEAEAVFGRGPEKQAAEAAMEDAAEAAAPEEPSPLLASAVPRCRSRK